MATIAKPSHKIGRGDENKKIREKIVSGIGKYIYKERERK